MMSTYAKDTTRDDSVAVVIVNYNGGALLADVIHGLAEQTRPPKRVIVVDNASSDGSADGLNDLLPAVQVIRSERNLGFAAGNNLGAELATDCHWIALLNPDARPEPEWLEQLLAAANRHPDAAMIGSLLLLADQPHLLDGAGDAYHVGGLAWRRLHGRERTLAPTDDTEVFSPCAAAAMYRREIYMSVGGLDERFFCYFEDIDLAFRLRLAGHRCILAPRSVVRHHGSALSGRESDFTIYHSHRNLVWTWIRDMPRGALIAAVPHHLLMTLLTVGWYTARGQGGAILRAKRDAIRGLPAMLRERRALHRNAVPAASVTMWMERGASGYETAWRRARASLAQLLGRS